MNELDYYYWCLSYINNIPLFASWYNRTDKVVSEDISPTTLEGLFGNIMTCLFNINKT